MKEMPSSGETAEIKKEPMVIKNRDIQLLCDVLSVMQLVNASEQRLDWQAAVRTWARHDSRYPAAQKPVKTVSAQQYGQRKYTEDELNNVSGDLLEEAKAYAK